MADETDVRIIGWPEGNLGLHHTFTPNNPAGVRLSFDEGAPARLAVTTVGPIDATLNLASKQDIPLCVKICDPICARSTYAISIDIFDRPVAVIKLQGETRLSACLPDGPAGPGLGIG